MSTPVDDPSALAVVGLAGRFPGAPDLDGWWQALLQGVVAVRRFSPDEAVADGVPAAEARAPGFVAARALLDDATAFDAAFFGLSPREALLTDPQHRLFLEACHAALEDAGIRPVTFPGPIGVYGGVSPNTWLAELTRRDPDLARSLGDVAAVIASDKDYVTTRAAYRLGLTGPAITVGTGCSTGLVAVQLAAVALLTGQCDVALAGAASVAFPQRGGNRHQAGHIVSPDGLCRPFDARAAGTVSGDGVGVVVLRRLADALADGDPVRAVLRGVAVNNDGARKIGFMAPGADGQAEVVELALGLAGVSARSIGYVQAHGTGTALGDPVEVRALSRVFRADGEGRWCALGSVKANVGHTNAAAGVAGLVAAVRAVEEGVIPPQALFQTPHPDLELDTSPFWVPTAPTPFAGPGPRRAGVTSLGVGGTNVHAVVEEPPARPAAPAPPGPHLLLLSAATRESLDAARVALADRLAGERAPHPADVAHTLAVGRDRHRARAWAVADDAAHGIAGLRGEAGGLSGLGEAPTDGARPVVLLLPGHGAQAPRMGEGWYAADPTFRAVLDAVADRARPTLGLDVRAALFGAEPRPGEPRLDDPEVAGVALFAVGLGLGRALQARGLPVTAVLGHSAGELAAVALGGLLAWEDALDLLLARGRAVARAPEGAVLHVALDAEAVEARLGPEAWVSLRNGPRATVVTGTPAGVAALEERLGAEGVAHRRVRVRFPVHSPLLDGAVPAVRAAAAGLVAGPGGPEVRSGLDGERLDAARATDPEHWARHLRAPADFRAAMATLPAGAVVVELGPAGSLRGLAAMNRPELPVVAALPAGAGDGPPEAWGARQVAAVWGALWAWGAHDAPGVPAARRVPLPTYRFDRARFDLPPLPSAATAAATPASPPRPSAPASTPARTAALRAPRPPLPEPPTAPRSEDEATLLRICEEVLGLSGIGVDDDFFALGGDSLVTLRLVDEVERQLGRTLPPQAAFAGLSVARLAPFLERAAPRAGTAEADPRRPGPARPAASPGDAVLLPFRTTGTRPPLYFAHPLTGVVFPYFPLARALGEDQPFYGLQAAGLDGSGAVDHTVEEMAARYCAAVREQQPHGPYHVGGYSFGALIAFEMARRFRAEGEPVGLVALVDEAAPTPESRPSAMAFARLFWGESGRNFLRHFQDYAFLADQGGGRSWRKAPRQLLERSALAMLLPPESYHLTLSQPGLPTLFDLLVLHMRATYAYTPPPTDVDLVLLKSDWTSTAPRWAGRGFPHDLGWGALTRGRVDVYRAAGDHLGMLRGEYAVVLAERLRQAFDETLARGGGAR